MPPGIQRDGLLIIANIFFCCCCCTGAFTLSHLMGFRLKLVDDTCQAYRVLTGSASSGVSVGDPGGSNRVTLAPETARQIKVRQ